MNQGIKQKRINFLCWHTSLPYDTHLYARSFIFTIDEDRLNTSWGRQPKHPGIALSHGVSSPDCIRKTTCSLICLATPGKQWLILGPSFYAVWPSGCLEKSYRIKRLGWIDLGWFILGDKMKPLSIRKLAKKGPMRNIVVCQWLSNIIWRTTR